jgi:hypothetical protein
MVHKLRDTMGKRDDRYMLDGEIEIDTWKELGRTLKSAKPYLFSTALHFPDVISLNFLDYHDTKIMGLPRPPATRWRLRLLLLPGRKSLLHASNPSGLSLGEASRTQCN